jgi:hypothetical protein
MNKNKKYSKNSKKPKKTDDFLSVFFGNGFFRFFFDGYSFEPISIFTVFFGNGVLRFFFDGYSFEPFVRSLVERSCSSIGLGTCNKIVEILFFQITIYYSQRLNEVSQNDWI